MVVYCPTHIMWLSLFLLLFLLLCAFFCFLFLIYFSLFLPLPHPLLAKMSFAGYFLAHFVLSAFPVFSRLDLMWSRLSYDHG